jgi:hypothetical protein
MATTGSERLREKNYQLILRQRCLFQLELTTTFRVQLFGSGYAPFSTKAEMFIESRIETRGDVTHV